MSIVNCIQVTLEAWSSVICLFMFLIIALGKRQIRKSSRWLMVLLFMNALMLAADSFAYIYRGNVSTIGFIMTRVSNFLVFAAEDVMVVASVFYIFRLVLENGEKPKTIYLNAIMLTSGISLFLLLGTQFNGFFYSFDLTNHYVRSNGIILNFVLLFFGVFVESYLILRYRKTIGNWYFYSLITYYMLLLVAVVLQYIFYGFSFISLSTTILTWMMYMSHEKDNIDKIEKQSLLLVEQEKEMAEGKNKMLVSSIQPHFIFNSLTAIKTLIVVDPKKAADAMDDLSVFLRGSIDILNQNSGMVPLHEELKIVRSYMGMTQIRFGETVHMDIVQENPDLDFMIPSFTIQPLLENAIHHGIRRTRYGEGNVRICIGEKEANYEILVEDDGVGFDPGQMLPEEKSHVGIRIVRERLYMMCHGTLEIVSEPGKGTICIISIPKE